MRPYVVIAAALAVAPAFVAAQDAQVPVCVYTCITGAAALTSCASSDTQCLCAADNFLAATVSCMQQSCDSDSLAYGLQFGEQYCAQAGVPVTLTGAASSAASEALSEAPSSIVSEASSVASSAAAAITSAASSSASSQSSAASSQSAAQSSASGSAPAPSQTGAGNGASALFASSALALVGAGAALLI